MLARIMIPEAFLRGLVWTAEQLGCRDEEALNFSPGWSFLRDQTYLYVYMFGNKGFTLEKKKEKGERERNINVRETPIGCLP